jgi:LPXTG-site transpeptidase (sortase) family protein
MLKNSKYNKVLTIILVIVILGIIGLLVYMGIDYYRKSQETSEGDEILGQLNDYLNQENGGTGTLPSGNANIINVPVNEVDTNTQQGGTSTSQLTYKGYLINGKIEIPRIDVEYPILEANKDTIQVAVGLLYGPGLNEVGNNVIIGHNFRDGRFFSDNDKLSIGDKIYITDLNNRRLEYKITKKYITDANDFSYAVRDTNGKREISLSTCTDDVSGRLIIWAEEV